MDFETALLSALRTIRDIRAQVCAPVAPEELEEAAHTLSRRRHVSGHRLSREVREAVDRPGGDPPSGSE